MSTLNKGIIIIMTFKMGRLFEGAFKRRGRLFEALQYTSYWRHRSLFVILGFPRSILEPWNGLKLFNIGWDTKCRPWNLLNNGASNITKERKRGKENALKPN